jgi:stage II sporulation SpoAA-like protein
MLELIDGLPGNIVGIAASGRVTMQDCQDVLVPAIKKSRKRHDKIRLHYELNSRFPGAAWDDLDLGLEHASCCERMAIVTDIGWVGLTVKALRFLIPSEIRVFPTIQAQEGRAWIRTRPESRSVTRPSIRADFDQVGAVIATRARARKQSRPIERLAARDCIAVARNDD